MRLNTLQLHSGYAYTMYRIAGMFDRVNVLQIAIVGKNI